MFRFRSTLLAAALTAFCACPALAQDAAPPSSQDDQKARELYELGNQRYEEGRYRESIEAFEEAYRLSERKALLFNLANANERMGNLSAAVRHLEAYLPHAAADEKATLERRLESLRQRAAEPEPPTAPPVPAPAAAPAASPAAAPAPAATPSTEPPAEESSSALPATGYVLMGLGAAGLIVGGVTGGLTLSARSTAEDECSGGLCTADGIDAVDREERYALGTDIALGLGGAAFATGVILLIVAAADDDTEGADSAFYVRPLASPSAAALTVGGTF